MSTLVTRKFEFSAAHWHTGLPKAHKCGRMHGHDFVVEVDIAPPATAEIKGDPFPMLQVLDAHIKHRCDHRVLNEEVSFNPTAENLASFFYGLLRIYYPAVRFTSVRVFEGPTEMAEYRVTAFKPPVKTTKAALIKSMVAFMFGR